MENTVSSNQMSSKEVLGNISSVLFQVHALSKTLEQKIMDEEDGKRIDFSQ